MHADPYAYGCDTAYSLAITTDDLAPPTSSVQPLPALSYVLFPVRWSGTDAGTGVASYDVQYRDGLEAAWTPWLTATAATTATFAGVVDHTYYFRCRAVDRAGNVEEWPAEPDAYTTAHIWPDWLPLVARK